MRSGLLMMGLAAVAFTAGCSGGSNSGSGGGGGGGGSTPAATPSITTAAAQNSAVIATLADTTPAPTIYFTTDGSTPTASSQVYTGPFLVASNLTVKAIATASGYTTSSVASQAFSPNIPSGTLVWSDEFTNTTSANIAPNSAVWTYDTGGGGFGNSELEIYCAAGSSFSPCDLANPNVYADTSGILHIVARNPSAGVYTSTRMKTEGLFSFQYGRIEARMMVPESQGMWPAFWMLGANINTTPWPACGEADILEHIDGSNPSNKGYDWTQSSVHGTSLNGGTPYTTAGFSAAVWHTYGMIWTKGQIQYYVDNPANIYETFDASNMAGTWPFDTGPQFVIMNLAVGGSWPGNPDSTTTFPSEVQVDYVRIYAN
jgi:beta-glucanase (GH16 family)